MSRCCSTSPIMRNSLFQSIAHADSAMQLSAAARQGARNAIRSVVAAAVHCSSECWAAGPRPSLAELWCGVVCVSCHECRSGWVTRPPVHFNNQISFQLLSNWHREAWRACRGCSACERPQDLLQLHLAALRSAVKTLFCFEEGKNHSNKRPCFLHVL